MEENCLNVDRRVAEVESRSRINGVGWGRKVGMIAEDEVAATGSISHRLARTKNGRFTEGQTSNAIGNLPWSSVGCFDLILMASEDQDSGCAIWNLDRLAACSAMYGRDKVGSRNKSLVSHVRLVWN